MKDWSVFIRLLVPPLLRRLPKLPLLSRSDEDQSVFSQSLVCSHLWVQEQAPCWRPPLWRTPSWDTRVRLTKASFVCPFSFHQSSLSPPLLFARQQKEMKWCWGRRTAGFLLSDLKPSHASGQSSETGTWRRKKVEEADDCTETRDHDDDWCWEQKEQDDWQTEPETSLF